MNPNKQHTLAGEVSTTGIALHTGFRVKMTMKPAPANTGKIFVRTDLPGKPSVEAIGTNVLSVERATTLKDGDAVFHTVEHVLAALITQGIDNVICEVDRPEPPVADGSSKPFIEMIKSVGAVEQDAEREYFTISKIHHIEQEHAIITMIPSDTFRISCTVKYDQSMLDCQYLSMEVTKDSFEKELSLARTFCGYHELEYLMNAGLIRGGSLDNATVIHGDTVLSKDGLRYEDEFVRHKMLDIVGDFSLLGKPLKAHIIAVKPGHPSNVTMTKQLLELAKKGEL